MSSPTTHQQPQFYTAGGISNLDRCNWCGELRAAHGPGWECPTRTGNPGQTPVILLVAGALVAVIGLVLVLIAPGDTYAQLTTNTTGGILLGAGGITAIAAAIVVRRRNAEHDRLSS